MKQFDFLDFALENGYGKMELPNEILNLILKFENYVNGEVKKLNIPAVSNNEVAVCSRCGLNTVSHPTKLCYKCWLEVG